MRHSPHALSLTVGALLAALLPAAQAAEPAEPDAAVLSEITVSATRSAEALRRDASAGKLVVGRQELDALNSSSVAELLRKLPGAGILLIWTTPAGAGAAALPSAICRKFWWMASCCPAAAARRPPRCACRWS